MRALRGHGWATTATLAATWRLRHLRQEIARAIAELVEEGKVAPCFLRVDGRRIDGWIRPPDLERAERLSDLTLHIDRAVLLSPFDPLLWDRRRVEQLFGFHQILEIFKPAQQRRYGYYCLPLLAGDRLVARCDLKAHRQGKRLELLNLHFEQPAKRRDRERVGAALRRYANRLELSLDSREELAGR